MESVARSGHSGWRRLLVETAILALLVYNTFIGGSTYGLYLLYPRAITQALYFGLIGLWLVMLLVRRRPFPRSPLDIPLLALGCIILAATLLSSEPSLSLSDVPLYFTYVLLYYMVIERVRSGWPASIFAKGLVMTVTIACLFALIEYLAWYFGIPLFPKFQQGWWSIGGWRDPIPPILYRLHYTLNNPNMLASLLASTMPLGVAAAVTTRSRWTRINAILWLAVCAVVLILTFSRGGWVSALIGLFAMAFLLSRRRLATKLAGRFTLGRYRLVLIGGVTAVAALLVTAYLVVPELNRPISDAARVTAWRDALGITLDHPLLGTGPRTYGARKMDYWDPAQDPIQSIYVPTAHNVPLHAAAEIGVPGAILVAAIAAIVMIAGYRQVSRLPPKQSVLMAGFLSGLVAFAAHSAVDMLLAVPAVMSAVVVLAAICTAGQTEGAQPGHRWLTPWRGLALASVMAALVAWSLFGMARLGTSAADGQSGRWDTAIAELQQAAVGSLPTSFQQFQLGLMYGKMASDGQAGDSSTAAIAHYESGLAAEPRYVPGRANLAALYWKQGNIAGARRELTAVADEMPEQPIYRLNLGLLNERQGDDQAAVESYARALAADPSASASTYWQQTDWRRRHWAEIRDRAQSYIEELGPASRAALYRAELAYYVGDLQTAATVFEANLHGAGGLDALHWLGRVMVAQGRFEEALTVFDAVIQRASGDTLAEAYRDRGQAYLALGRDDDAWRDLATALSVGNVDAQYELGQLRLRAGDVESAIARLRQSLRPLPDLLQVNMNFDFLFYRQGGIYDSNLLPVPGVPPPPSHAAIYLELADLYIGQGETEQARQVCQELLDLSPDYQPAVEKLRSLSD